MGHKHNTMHDSHSCQLVSIEKTNFEDSGRDADDAQIRNTDTDELEYKEC